ncbi:MAG: carbohydrate binding domain-containing protein, partial [Armatimonadetes bacterium]|nr:carbohydrate binding domain-containing protein [Armatimonadota bacterium]
MAIATLAFCLCLASPNLLDNGGFELAPTPGSAPDGWNTWAPAGVTIVQDETVARSGRASLRLEVAAGTEIQWYQAHRPVQPIRRGATYTFSAWIRTRDARDGSGAYLSLNAYDGNGTRIGVFDSERKVTGTSDWVRVTTTAAV